MQTQITVRLSGDLEKRVGSAAKKMHLKRSDIVRIALERYLEEFKEQPDEKPYEKVKHLIGSFSSGISDLGTSHREHLLRKFKKIA